VLRKVFGSEREEVTGDCRKLCKALYYLCSWSNNIVPVMKTGTMGTGNATIMSEKTNAVSVFLTLRLLMSYIYIYGASSKARNANVVYIWTYVWQR